MRILSGATPTGPLHLGNYFGALRQWIELQTKGEGLYFIADYHALTTVRDPEVMAQNTFDQAVAYLALGLDPERAILWRQSDIPEVCELTWILSTVTPMGLLERCHAYKDKTARGISPDHGLFAYPVLMAADILLFHANLVPVGDDQKQHVEVTRDLAIKFNNTYGETLTVPEEHIVEAVGRVPGVDNEKMSASYGNEIRIFDTDKKVRKKIMSIVTDSKEVDEPKEPEGNVVFELYKLMATAEETAAFADRFRAGGLGYGDAKKTLNERFQEYFADARARETELREKPGEVEEILQEGAKRARAIADETLDQVRTATGLSRRIK